MTTDHDMSEIFQCDCHANEHMIKVDMFVWSDMMPEFCMSVTADAYLPWYRRIWVAIKYMFGYPTLAWHDVMLSPANVDKLYNIIVAYKTHMINIPKGINDED